MPAYDICPKARTGTEASQAMLIVGNRRLSRRVLCREAAANFRLSPAQADPIITTQVKTIRQDWSAMCDEAGLSPVDRGGLRRRQVLNPFVFEGLRGPLSELELRPGSIAPAGASGRPTVDQTPDGGHAPAKICSHGDASHQKSQRRHDRTPEPDHPAPQGGAPERRQFAAATAGRMAVQTLRCGGPH
jgi:hypothetical protein